ncbi:MAG: hypothetical protein ABJH04_08060 [Cyclobacteriaceae bacterium]
MAKLNKVVVGQEYRFNPVMIDRADPKTNLRKGMRVVVVELPGAPKANTMGHCHISQNGTFAGMVHVNSLETV